LYFRRLILGQFKINQHGEKLRQGEEFGGCSYMDEEDCLPLTTGRRD